MTTSHHLTEAVGVVAVVVIRREMIFVIMAINLVSRAIAIMRGVADFIELIIMMILEIVADIAQ